MSESTTNGHAPAAWLPDVLAYLEKLKTLKANWDGYNADAPRPEVVDAAAAYIRDVAARTNLPVPYAAPTPIGGVGFEWRNGPHSLEIEFTEPDVIETLYFNSETDAGVEGKLKPGQMPDPEWVNKVTVLEKV
jgi:hypothetical protein